MSDELLNWRAPTAQEKDTTFLDANLKKKSPILLFKEHADKVDHEYLQVKRKPFCKRCAYLDYKDIIEEAERERQRTVGRKDIQLPTSFDLKPYAEESRFKLQEPRKIIANDKGKFLPLRETTYKEFKCNVRGCRFSIQISDKVYAGSTEEMSEVQPQRQEAKGKQ